MSNDESNCDGKVQPGISTPKNKNLFNENVVTPEVKILNRGDLLGAINCLFPELQLKSAHIKLKENFSLFSYSQQELTRIFESGRKYRTGTTKTIKCSHANQSVHSLRIDLNSRKHFKRNAVGDSSISTKNIVTDASKPLEAQKKRHTYEAEPLKRDETVQFPSNHTDFVTKLLEPYYPDRFIDFKNIECVIQELDNMCKEISKEYKIGPFNPNLPVLNISECDQVAQGPRECLKPKTSTKRRCPKKKSRSRTQIDVKGKGKKSIVQGRKRRIESEVTNQNGRRLHDDYDERNAEQVEQIIEDVFKDDSFSPRYNAKHTLFHKPLDKSDSTIFNALEKEAIEQYENGDGAVDMNFI